MQRGGNQNHTTQCKNIGTLLSLFFFFDYKDFECVLMQSVPAASFTDGSLISFENLTGKERWKGTQIREKTTHLCWSSRQLTMSFIYPSHQNITITWRRKTPSSRHKTKRPAKKTLFECRANPLIIWICERDTAQQVMFFMVKVIDLTWVFVFFGICLF